MFIDVRQNSEEWFNLRVGKATSSNFAKIMANEGKAFGIPAQEYAQKIALEIVTGLKDETASYSNQYMARGHDLEPIACELYEMENFVDVTNGGFNDHGWLGDSPDGNVGDDGCIEIKCVVPNTQWKRYKKGGIDSAYKWQIHAHIWLGHKLWCDFISYCPEFPEDKQLYVHRVHRDNDMIDRLESRVLEFKELIDQNVELIK